MLYDSIVFRKVYNAGSIFLIHCIITKVNSIRRSPRFLFVTIRNKYPAFSQDTYIFLAAYIGQLVRRLLAEVKSEGSHEPVHRCSGIRSTAFILTKLIELLGKNRNDERASMYRYFGVINLHRHQF